MDLQAVLTTFAQQITLTATGGTTPGSLVTAALSPDPVQTGLLEGIQGLTRTTVLLKMLRFADDSLPEPATSVNEFVTNPTQVLGGQAMPAISVELPGPALPGTRIPLKQLSGGGGLNSLAGLNIAEDVAAQALPKQPSLGGDPGADLAHDVLSGVPGIVGVIETGQLPPEPLRVQLEWTFALDDGSAPVTKSLTLGTLNVVPPLKFVDVDASTVVTMTITVKGVVYAPDPTDPTDASKAKATATISPPPVSVTVPGLPMPRLLALFTWPLYGTESAQGDSNPDDSSLLLMWPADSPLTGATAVTNAIQSLKADLAPVQSLLSLPLDAASIAPFGDPTTTLQLIKALATGLDRLTARMSVLGHGAYIPVFPLPASPTLHSALKGGISDLNGVWWDDEGTDKDYFHDHAKSFLWLAPAGGKVVIYRDKGFSYDPKNLDDHGRMTLITGSTCLVGIPDFRQKPDAIDPMLAPNLPGLIAPQANREGWFTNEHPPNGQGNWAWTDSFEFLD